MDRLKRPKVEEEEQIDGQLLSSIEKLQEIQDDLERINEEASDKVLEVEQKHNEIRQPVYARRNEIIQTIPDFWLTAFLSHPTLCDLLTEEDQKVFKYLQSLDVEDFKDVKSGYTITFTFHPNPYFEDRKLTKVFSFSDDGTANVSGTSVKWKDGMNVTNGTNVEKDGNKRPFQEESFFSWFGETPQNNSADGMHDEIAEIIKEDLWPNPMKYFNNDAEEEYEDGEADDYDEDGGSLDEDGEKSSAGDGGEDGDDEEVQDNNEEN
eukprot:TRINITY_DN2112_c0_g1_i1.p1 TRINITY_DN2112_c0_g1~~TRINITY_DN2112_c0_g1_i1.p1  ORF type:complete len:265 (-),score=82.89 TRINITY_DN2112_c0_g1_i1:420-1214(-)